MYFDILNVSQSLPWTITDFNSRFPEGFDPYDGYEYERENTISA